MRKKNDWELNQKRARKPIEANTPHNLEPEHPSEFYEFKKREGVHTYHEHQPTLWKPRNSRAKKGNQTSCDVVLTTRTKMVGRANMNGWNHPSTSKKKLRKVEKAKRWIENNHHRI